MQSIKATETHQSAIRFESKLKAPWEVWLQHNRQLWQNKTTLDSNGDVDVEDEDADKKKLAVTVAVEMTGGRNNSNINKDHDKDDDVDDDAHDA